MTPRDLAYEALSYIVPSGAPSNQATLTLASARQKARIAADLTAAMQEIYGLAPGLYRRTLGATMAAPTTITLNAINGSQTVTTGDTFVEGATVYVGGIFNQIFTEGGTKKLATPYAGSTGAVSATLYGDVVLLGADVSKVLDQVCIADGRKLTAKANRTDLLGGVRDFPDYGRRLTLSTTKPTVGDPLFYLVEDFTLIAGTAHTSQKRLRTMPLPRSQTQITYDVKLRAPSYIAADLGTDDDEATRTFSVADDYHQLLIRPLFLERWAGSPWFRDDAAWKWIAEEAKGARALLSTFNAQQKRSRRIIAPI